MSDIIVSKQDANQVLRLAFDDATQALRTTGSAATTVTVIQPDGALLHMTVDESALPDGAATEAKQDTGNTSLSSIDTKLSSQATAANQTTANASLSSIDSKLTSPLSVTGPLTDTQLRASPVPVSGTVAVSNPGLTDTELRASPVPVSGPLTDTELRASAVPVSAASLPLPSGAATAANQATEIASLSSIDSKLTSPLTVTGPLTDVQLRATPVPVSGTIAVTGVATAANQATEIASLASIDSKTPALGQALAAASVPVVLPAAQITTLTPLSTVTVTQATGTNLHATIDNFPATQPVSGTVAVSNFPATQPISAASLPLPTGAATETTLASINTKTPALGQTIMSGSSPVVLASDQSAVPVSFSAKAVNTTPVYTVYSSTPVTTSAYTQLVASTSAAITHLSIFDSSGQAMILATGAAASEVVKLYIPPGGGEFDLAIPTSTRISIKALTADASSGYNLLNMLT